jgi:hypothetical protein
MVCILLSAASEVEVLPKDTSPYDVFQVGGVVRRTVGVNGARATLTLVCVLCPGQGPVHFSAVKRGWQVAWSASAYNLLEVGDREGPFMVVVVVQRHCNIAVPVVLMTWCLVHR